MQTLRDEWFIYGLTDPRVGIVRYVGYTTDLSRRLYQHIYHKDATDSHKNRWIRALLSDSITPEITVLEVGSGEWRHRERYWIQQLKSNGIKLTNSTNGGDGASGLEVSEETRRKIGEYSKQTGRWKNWNKAAITANTGRKQSPETIAKRVEKLKGRALAEEAKQKIREKAIGRRASEETRKKMSEARLGKKASAEARAAISRGLKGHTVSHELRAKFSRERLGVAWSEERRTKFNQKREANAS